MPSRPLVKKELIRTIETELMFALALVVLLGMVLGYALAAATTSSQWTTKPSSPADTSIITPLGFDGSESDLLF
ncbi:TPA: hypothetical protein DHW58_01320 [Patescibacteria group bacterium]|uniref:Uncharacterized protein n=2 Tax=Bacteria division Kazan-3B-28 TaxID=1798534 RepID=A0A0G1X7F5_UNCK3|nr:MAG: hypothetical protein VE98_C0001G0097 [candidate division Kazan bacterium GW2011_GWA1_50_15]KKW25626.1 MAG: hypothetical protein VE99_C0001G0263 [candidate division Kazan bacterium GW2011_GWC1_52_13]KKW26931.1 MAG: hypothetical protein VF00_C0002G0256 [candidate division Kazan bacterium GW2011_GWB1_52_7]HAV66080.1 hypothetical protein [Patescibacteria group bacterium]HCL47611.1 hypothetical protein [Patescibacteria group bacterium]